MGTKLTEEQIRKATLAAIKACKLAGLKDIRDDRNHADNIETFGVRTYKTNINSEIKAIEEELARNTSFNPKEGKTFTF